jgi:transcriptional regulator with XRE-family HTH domain
MMPGRTRPYRSDVASDGGVVGRNIRRRREEIGMFTTTLAARVGVSQGYLANVELGRQTPRLNKLKRFADVLAVSLHELVDESPSAEFERGRRAGMIEAIAALRERLEDT